MSKLSAATGAEKKYSPTKVVLGILLLAVVVYALTELCNNGLWFVALGIVSLTVCALVGALLIHLSSRTRMKSFDVIETKGERK